MSARSWRVAGPFGSQELIFSASTDHQTGQGYRQAAGTPNPLIGSPAGFTVMFTVVALQDWGIIPAAPQGFGLVCSGDVFTMPLVGGFVITATETVVPRGFKFTFIQSDSAAPQILDKGLGTGFYPKRGNGIIVTINYDNVSGLMKLKTSYDSDSAQLAVAGFLPFTGAAISDYAFSIGHFNTAIFGIDAATGNALYGIANVYYSETKSQWTDQEITDFEDEIKAIMSTDSELPIPEGTQESDWTIFDSRRVASGSGSGPWVSRNGVYTLRSDLFAHESGNGNNEFQQLRNINFPVSGL